MILTHDVIVREIEEGHIVIEPFSFDQIGPASIDLHLGTEIRVMDGPDVIAVTDATDYRSVTEVRRLRHVGVVDLEPLSSTITTPG